MPLQDHYSCTRCCANSDLDYVQTRCISPIREPEWSKESNILIKESHGIKQRSDIRSTVTIVAIYFQNFDLSRTRVNPQEPSTSPENNLHNSSSFLINSGLNTVSTRYRLFLRTAPPELHNKCTNIVNKNSQTFKDLCVKNNTNNDFEFLISLTFNCKDLKI